MRIIFYTTCDASKPWYFENVPCKLKWLYLQSYWELSEWKKVSWRKPFPFPLVQFWWTNSQILSSKMYLEIHEFQDFYILRIHNFEMVDEKRVTSTGTASVSYKHFRFPRKEGRKSYHRSSCDFRIKVFHENPEKSTLFFATLKIMLSNHFRFDDIPIKVIRLALKMYLVFIPTLKSW